jgi:hypothetical protein
MNFFPRYTEHKMPRQKPERSLLVSGKSGKRFTERVYETHL